HATTPNPRPGDINENNAADTGAVYYLNLPVPTAGNHAIIVQCLDGATIFRNNQISGNAYPFSIGNVFSITGNSTSNPADTSDATYQQRFYYFFYNMGVRLAACPSPSRTAVVATTAPVPVITMAGNVLTSSSASGNQWYLNNNVIAGATSQTFTAVTPGVYKTVIVDSFGCASSSNEINSASTPVVDINGTTIALVASPNPNKGQFYLQFEVKGKDDLLISLVNNLGQEVYTSRYPGFTGRFNQQINAGKIGSGMYILKIQHNKKVFVKKLLIE
ncbi:MAG TPA: T9SS type A sorting domain-containing protein, partial [Chitinophagaceae bacterium]|nr:T9SS type A sorting domain-containing protein [Chitinophagaceae bacterium]